MRISSFVFCLFFLLEGVLLSTSFGAGPQLEVRVFAVGQGNFILLKSQDEYFVVDVFFFFRRLMNPNGSIYEKLKSIVGSISKFWMAITHSHGDHHCLYKQFAEFLEHTKGTEVRDRIYFPYLADNPRTRLGYLAGGFRSEVKNDQVKFIQKNDMPFAAQGNAVYYLPPHEKAKKDH